MKLPGPSLTNANVGAALDLVHTAMASGDFVVDLGDIRHVDSSAVALLVAVMRDAKTSRARVELRNPPAALVSLAQLYGVDHHLLPELA